ncbi:hypothetical protein TYRP_006767 [Tyrophagus putrescentiae]|nr:hypothetical protein TYRP_006767 [Tyrophagus putrescentiae]
MAQAIERALFPDLLLFLLPLSTFVNRLAAAIYDLQKQGQMMIINSSSSSSKAAVSRTRAL